MTINGYMTSIPHMQAKTQETNGSYATTGRMTDAACAGKLQKDKTRDVVYNG